MAPNSNDAAIMMDEVTACTVDMIDSHHESSIMDIDTAFPSARNVSKRRIRPPQDASSKGMSSERDVVSEQHHASKKCRRVSTTEGDIHQARAASAVEDVNDVPMQSAQAAAAAAAAVETASATASSVSSNSQHSVIPSTRARPIVRRVSSYFDDVRESFRFASNGRMNTIDTTQFHEQTDRPARAGCSGTRTPRLVTPSSSFLVGSVDPAVGGRESSNANEAANELSSRETTDVAADVNTTIITSNTENETTTAIKDNPTAKSVTEVSTTGSSAKTPSPTKARATPSAPRRTWKHVILTRIIPLLILLEAGLLIAERIFDLPFDPTFSLHDHPIHPDSVYVPGAGFSGFWFTLGRLKSIPDPASKSYYCYSAGCLGVVATLSERSMEEMSDLAFGVQRMWKDGEVDRYDVVTKFVDGLLATSDDGMNGGNSTAAVATTRLPITTEDSSVLSKINVITTAKEVMGVKSVIRTPRSLEELRDMLIHTTWIPYATGDGMWTQDIRTGHHHMDGAFSATTHPRCTHHLGLPFMMDLFLNILNVNLGRDKVEKYWKAGVAMGL
mmetsp:Transcript_32838/g.72066  ORF Transcript_32838/g.72066 Transcript_32838/m.72066 type:complete len:559 (+) Transcript_32838:158-1834(+)